MPAIDRTILEAVKDAYQRSLLGVDGNTGALREVFGKEPLAGPLAIAILDGIVEPLGNRARDIIVSAHSQLGGSLPAPSTEVAPPTSKDTSAESASIFKKDDPLAPKAPGERRYLSIAEAFWEEANKGNTIKMFRQAREYLEAKPSGDDTEFRNLLSGIFHQLVRVDQANPGTVSSETVDAIAVFRDKTDMVSASAINTWVFGILLPANRVDDAIEALSWVVLQSDQFSKKRLAVGPSSIRDRIELWAQAYGTEEAFLEDLNSLSNLSAVFLQNGYPNKGRTLLSAIQSCGLPTLVTESDFWMAQVRNSTGKEDAAKFWLRRTQVSAKLCKDSHYETRATEILAGKQTEPQLDMSGYPDHTPHHFEPVSADDWKTIPSAADAKAFLEKHFPQITSLSLDSVDIPDLSPPAVSDWAQLVFPGGKSSGSDWAPASSDILAAGFLLAKSTEILPDTLNEWVAEFINYPGGPEPRDLKSLYTLLVESSFLLEESKGSSVDIPALLCLGVVILDAANSSSPEAKAFRSAVSAIVVNGLLRGGETDLATSWAEKYPGDGESHEWLLASAHLASFGEDSENLLAALTKLDGASTQASLYASVGELLENKEWEEIAEHWRDLLKHYDDIILNGRSGYSLIEAALGGNTETFEASTPLAAAALSLANFTLDRDSEGFRWWLGARKVTRLPKTVLERPGIDIEMIVEAEEGTRGAYGLGVMSHHRPTECMFALLGLWRKYYDQIPDIMDDLVEQFRTNEHVEWPFDFAALWATLSGTPTEEQLLGLISYDDARVRSTMAESAGLTDKVAQALLDKAADSEKETLAAAAVLSPHLTESTAQMLTEYIGADELWKVAANPKAPTHLIASWAKHESETVRRAVARNTSTPDEVLAELALDRSLAVRDAVANNPAASDETRAIVSLQT